MKKDEKSWKYQTKLYLFELEPRQEFCMRNLRIARKYRWENLFWYLKMQMRLKISFACEGLKFP
jgi:hypothetical protein